MSTRSSHVTNRHGIVGQPSYVSSSFSQVTGIARVVHNAFKRISMNDTRYDEYRRYDKEELQPGTIIRAPLHEEDFNRTKPSELSSMSSAKSSHISFSDRFGVRVIYSESRLLIVVAAFSRHFLAIPLYTYASTGLKYKDDVGEYASIQDHHQPSSLEETAYSFTTAELKEGVSVFPQCSVAPLAYPVPRLNKLHVAHQGMLEAKDTQRKLTIFQRIMANPLRNIETYNTTM